MVETRWTTRRREWRLILVWLPSANVTRDAQLDYIAQESFLAAIALLIETNCKPTQSIGAYFMTSQTSTQ